MKKNILFFLSLALIVACSPRKKQQSTSVGLKGFYAYYNTLFNGKEALESELDTRKKGYQDNFYNQYIPLLKAEENPLNGTDIEEEGGMFSSDESLGGPGAPSSMNTRIEKSVDINSASVLQIAEAKALKAISKYSVMKGGQEKNKRIFDAYIILAQSRLLMDQPLQALDAVNYLFSNMSKDKDVPLAKIYQAQAYTKMKDYYRADEVFREVKEDKKLKKSHAKLLSVYYSEMLLENGKKIEAIQELEEAFDLNKKRELRSRIAFLRGQILNEIGKPDEARESFVTAYKYSNDFQFEVKSQIEIAKTFNGSENDYEGAKKYIEDISKKGTYASRKNEFYYALGLMANKAGKTDEAQQYFRKSIEGQVSDPQIRGQAYYEIGQQFFKDNDYISAGAYYDSAVTSMTYLPIRRKLESTTQDIKKITNNYYLIKKNDSILALSRMSNEEKVALFNKKIEALKVKEAKEELERRKEERSKGFDTGDYNANTEFIGNQTRGFQDFSEKSNKGTFYFSNTTTVSKGNSEFKQIWGSRSLGDNWRYSTRPTTIEDIKNEAMGIQSAQNPRRFEPEYYIEQIPTDKEILANLKKDRDTASLGLGRMYEAFFSKTSLATKTLYDLVDQQPEEEVELQALYSIFMMNYEKTPSDAERAKNLIIQKFPYTSYAEFVKNPKSNKFSASTEEVEKKYTDAFDLYNQEKYEESSLLIKSALEAYPKDALVPKFALLDAFNTGKTAGKEIMILQLEQIALNYPKTIEGLKAIDMLKYLKSDLSLELTNDQGAILQDQQPKVKPQKDEVPQYQGPASPSSIPINKGDIGRPIFDELPEESIPLEKPKKTKKD